MSLLIWLPLHGDLTNYGSSPVTFSLNTSGGGVAAATSGGKTDASCYQRTTINTISHITSSAGVTLSNDFSMACWCYATTAGDANSANGVLTNHNHADNSGSGITLRYMSATDCRISCNTGNGSARTFHTYYGTTNIYGAWHHLCLTYNKAASEYKLYVDGVCENTFTYGNSAKANKFNIFDWSTGHSTNGSYRPACKVNDVRVYDHKLSPKEVKLLSQGLVAHYKLDGGGNNNLLVNTWDFSSSGGGGTVTKAAEGWYQKSYTHPAGSSSYADFCSWTGPTVNANETYTVSFLARSSNSTGNLVVYFYNNGSGVQVSNITSSQGHNKSGTDGNCQISLTNNWERYWITWKFNTTATPLVKTLLFRILKDGGQVDIAQVKLEKGSKATPYALQLSETNYSVADDCSGYNRNGTANGAFALEGNSPRHNCCTVFDGSTTKIELKIKALMQALLKDQCTINFWVNEDNTGSRSVYFGGYNGSNFNIEMESAKFRVYWNGSPDMYCAANTVTSGVWAMFTVVIDVKTGIKIYKNGAHLQSHNAALSDITSGFSNDTFRIGADSRTGATMAECRMSDFRIYCSALSATDIEALYKSAGAVTKDGGLVAYDFSESVENAKMHNNGVFTGDNFSERGLLSDMQWTTLSDGSCWARVFYHKTNSGSTLFTSYNEIMNTTSANKYSRLYLLPQLKATDGKLEMMLTYPTDYPGQYNRWKQTNAPQDEYVTVGDGSANAAGYSAISIAWTSYYWGGLTRQNSSTTGVSSTFISGSVGHGNWFYAIGAIENWNNGIPGPNGSKGMQDVELWVRIDTLPLNKKLNIMKEQSVSSSLFLEI